MPETIAVPAEVKPGAATGRVRSIDLLRGIVMVVMALDHTRDYFHSYSGNPTDLTQVSTALFLTRWVTHFCAPVFVFLSGTSAYLSMGRGKTKREEAWRLLTRGLWLILLELTLIRIGWSFDVTYSLVFLQVIWAIGVSMIVLSALIFLPRTVILTIALVMIGGHNLLDDLHPAGSAGVLWQVLHVQSPIMWGNGNTLMILYPLVPWVGVMAAGYCFGAVVKMEAARRQRWLYGTGLGAIALFIVIRFTNVYGDPSPWHAQTHWWRTVLSFINCTKYPPSLLYLLMTLGPAITFIALMQARTAAKPSKPAAVFTVYGRVPLFYYILHIYLLHGMAVLCSYLFRQGAAVSVFAHPGYSLGVVYVFWLSAVALLYLPCRWFMRIKTTHRKWWLSYL
jgi:uncharacterized membrane protein